MSEPVQPAQDPHHRTGSWFARWDTPAVRRAGAVLVVLLQVAFVLAPLVITRELAHNNRTNTLFLDDWAYVPLYEKAVQGTLTMHDFFGGYLEHRPAIARVIAIATTLLSKGDVRWQTVVTFCTIALTWVNCGLLLRRALGGWRQMWMPWGIMSWVMFCPVQWQEFLWPSCHMDALPLLFLTSSLLVLGKDRWSPWLRLGLCVAFAWLATYSFAAGLTLWVLIPLTVAFGYGFEEVRARKQFLLAWAVPAGVVLFCYFHGLKNEVDAPFAYGQGHVDTMTHSVESVLHSPEKGLKFALTLVGSNQARGVFGTRSDVALWLGIGGFAILVLGVVGMVRDWKCLENRRAALPLAMIAFYGLSVAGMVAAGRAWASKDVGGALNNRYACFASAFVAGVAGLLAVQRALALRGASAGPGLAGWMRQWTGGIGGVLCGLLIANWCYGGEMMRCWHWSRMRGAVDVMFAPLLGQAQDRGQPFQNIRLAIDRAATMDRLGFLHPPLATTLNLSQFAIKGSLEDKLGRFISTDRSRESIDIRGFAMLTVGGRPPDAVLITCRSDAAPEPRIVDVALPDNLPAFFLTSTMKDNQYVLLDDYRPRRLGEWKATVKRESLPKGGKVRIEAWALNFEQMAVREIDIGFTIEN